MKKNKVFFTFFVTLILSAFLISPALAADKPIKWKAQSMWGAAELSHKTFVDFCARVKVLTNGRLEITPYSAGTVVPTFEALDALQNNVIQAMHMWPGYFSGAYAVGWMFWGIESMVSTKSISRMEDFKGLKMRVPQGMTAMLFQELGASVVVLPGGEVFSALDKGVINTSDWASPSMNQRMGFFQVAKYTNYPGFHSMPMASFTVNMNEWNKLPDDIKQILKTACREWCWDSIERIAIDDIRALKEMKGKGVTVQTWSKEDLTRVRAKAMAMWDEFAKKSPMAKIVIDSQKEWLRELKLIE